MYGDSPPPLTLGRRGDLDVMRILAKIPKVPGRSVARRRADSTGKYGSHVAGTHRQETVADRKNALVDAMQLPISHPPPDCIPTEAESAKLARADHPVLALRDL